jgi:hypothetical protein
MKQCFRIAVLIAAGMGFGPAMIVAQANSATPNGTMAQVQTAISPEDRATKEQLAKLFEVMRIRDQMLATRRIIPTMVEGQVRQQMQAMSAQIAPDSKMTVEQRAQLDQMLHKYMEKAMDMYPVDEMIADMTGLYQEHLTREDVDAMIAFYGSPAGQHVLDAQPKIAQEYVPLVMRRTAERTKTLTAEMMKDMAALKQSSGRTQPANK